MLKMKILLPFLFAVTGCMTAFKSIDVPASYDQSTRDRPVVIRGSRSGVNGLDCFVSSPYRTRELITDAGKLSIQTTCYFFGGVMGERTVYSFAQLEFDAEPDHIYEIVGYSLCRGCGQRSELDFEYAAVVDATNQDRLVIRKPLYDSASDAVKSASMAVINLSAPRNDFRCRLSINGETVNRPGLVEPGRLDSTARCLRYNNPFGSRTGNRIRQAYAADISFDALRGRVYRIDIDESNPTCIEVSEISHGEELITCEPAEQLDELIGLDRGEIPR